LQRPYASLQNRTPWQVLFFQIFILGHCKSAKILCKLALTFADLHCPFQVIFVAMPTVKRLIQLYPFGIQFHCIRLRTIAHPAICSGNLFVFKNLDLVDAAGAQATVIHAYAITDNLAISKSHIIRQIIRMCM
jgi:hypothetical protein